MTWLSNVLIEVLATIIYIFVLIPCWIVLHLCFMVLVVLLLPFKIPAINRYVMTKMKHQKQAWYNIIITPPIIYPNSLGYFLCGRKS